MPFYGTSKEIVLFFLPAQVKKACQKQNQHGYSVGYTDSGGCIHEEGLRYNIDQQIRSRVQNPQVIVEENMVEHDKVF